jgi:penicillin-binding protein 2
MGALDARDASALDPRRRTLSMILVCVMAALVIRLFWLQVVRHDHFAKLSYSNQLQRERIPAPRGIVRARYGEKLVVNAPVYQISVLPNRAARRRELLALACEWLRLDPAKVESDLDAWMKRYADGREMTVIQAANKEQISVLRENRELLSFFKLAMRPRRYFPEGALAAHLFGYIGEATDQEIGGPGGLERGDIIGRTGLEAMYERYLRGVDGVRIVGISVEGQPVGEIAGLMDGDEIERLGGARPSVPGCDVHLTIDLALQRAAEEAFKWARGALVAMDPRTGEILAMVSRPVYDPNMFIEGLSGERWRELFEDPERPMFNRTVQAAYPPGSVFKPVTAYAALVNGRVNADAYQRPCPGGMWFGNRYFRCWQARGHGSLALRDALIQSCDTYFYQLGEKLDVDELAAVARLFGLGRKTGIDLPSEVSGVVPDKAYLDRRFGKRGWTKGLMLNFSIGQGEILTTPVQLCAMTARVANGGTRVEPHVVKEIVDADGAVVYRFRTAVERDPAIDRRAVEIIREALRGVVANDRGTGRAAGLPRVAVAGKTGTAQNPHGEDHALFVAYAPAEAPTICLAIVMENAGHGGAMAAPVARLVLAAHFAEPEGPPAPPALAAGGRE